MIVLFREWQRGTVPRSVAEHAIARLLSADKIYPKIETIFRVFSEIGSQAPLPLGIEALLSKEEESLLSELAIVFKGSDGSISIRLTDRILRSNSDAISARVHQSFWDCLAGRGI